jgi:hypothetical protein
VSDGSSFEIDLGVKGGDAAASAASALDTLASKLESAGAASTAASAAMAAGQGAYDASEKAALRASVALEKIGLAAAAQTGKAAAIAAEYGLFSPQAAKASEKLAALTAAQANAATKAATTAAAMNAEAASLDKLRAASSAATTAEEKLGKAHDDAKKKIAASDKASKDSADAQAKSVGTAGLLEGAFAKLGGPLGDIGQKATGALGAFLKLGKGLGDAGPYVALAVVAVALAAGIAAAGIAAAGATLAILKLGVTNGDTARTARLLAEEAKGGAAGLAATAKLALSLDNQSKKLKENIGKIFSVGAGPLERFLEGLGKMGALFEEGSVTANAIKVLFGSFFDPMLDGITKLIPRFVTMFIQFEILVMKAMIAIKPWGSTILDVAKVVGVLALVVGVGLAVAIGVVVAGIALMAVGIGIAIALVTAIIAAFVYFAVVTYQAGASLIDGIGAAFEWLKGLSLSEIGTQLIDGLVAGLMSAGPKVLSAITGIAKGAITAAKTALGIASPSKVFAEIGMHTAAGMEQGVDGGADAVQGSMEAIVEPPAVSGGGGAPAASAGASGGIAGGAGGNVYNITINGASGDDDFLSKLRDACALLSIQSGGGAPANG